MKKLLLLLLFAIAIAVNFNSCSDEAADFGNEPLDAEIKLNAMKATKSTTDVIDPYTGLTWGTSTLHRNDSGITVNYKVEGLIPGHAYTLWWVVWNNPENCAGYPGICMDTDFANHEQIMPEVMYAAGHVVGEDGIGNFSGRLAENDASGSINVEFMGLPSYGGLLDARGAEVHTLLHSHGPAIPGLVHEQISSFWGGCEVDLGIFTGNIPMNPGECATILAAVHQPE